MKLRENWRLGTAPIRAKKWRHFLVIVTMGVVLGLVMAIGLGIAGLEREVRLAEPDVNESGTGQIMDLALSNVKVTSVLDLFLSSVSVKTPFVAYEVSADKTFAKMWQTYTIAVGVLLAVALVIIVMTLVRLLGQEAKNQRLYRARGAGPGDLKRIYGCYALVLGIIVCILAVVIGVVSTVALSLVYAEPLTQVFELAYGVETQVWLIGWDWRLLVILGLVPVVMMVTGVLGSKK